MMKSMKKRILSLLLSVCFMLALMQVVSVPAKAATSATNTLQLSSENKSGEGWKWEYSGTEGTLTLEGLDYIASGDLSYIFFFETYYSGAKSANLVINGTNTIAVNDVTRSQRVFYLGNIETLNISGNGTLAVTSNSDNTHTLIASGTSLTAVNMSGGALIADCQAKLIGASSAAFNMTGGMIKISTGHAAYLVEVLSHTNSGSYSMTNAKLENNAVKPIVNYQEAILAVGHTVTYNTNGGSTVSPATMQTTFTVPTAPTKSGATFDGWYSQIASASNNWSWGTQYSGGESLTGPLTVYARWKHPLTLSKNDMVSAVSAGSSIASGDSVAAGTNVTVTATMPENNTEKSYIFQGWSSDVSGISGSTAEYTFRMPNSAVSLQANGIGGVPAIGTLTVNPWQLKGDCAVTVGGAPNGSVVTLRDSDGNVVHTLTRDGTDHKITTPQDGATYAVWVDGFDSGKTVALSDTTKSVTVDYTTYTFTATLDGDPYTDFGTVTIKAGGSVYPNGTELPTNSTHEVHLNGEKVGTVADFTGFVLPFYTVSFTDGGSPATTYANDTPFKQQVVLKGGVATQPAVIPANSDDTKAFSGWNHTFSTKITAQTTIAAQWLSLGDFEARWVIDGETFYGTLDEALEAVADNGGGHITVQKDAAVNETATLPDGGTLVIPDSVTVTTNSKLTSNGTITNDGTISGNLTNGGKLVNNGTVSGGLSNSGTVEGGSITGNVTNTGSISGSTIGGTTSNTGGTLTDCVVGGNVSGGKLEGYIYAEDGVRFSGVDASDATVCIEGGNTERFAGLADESGDTITINGDLILRNPITVDGQLDLNDHSIRGQDGASSDTQDGTNGVTPIVVDNGGNLIVTGPGSIIGGNGGSSESGDGGDGGHGIDASQGGSVTTDENTNLVGGHGGTASGNGNTGGNGGSGVWTGAGTPEITVEGGAQGGNGGPAVDGATGGNGGDAIGGSGNAIIRDGGGDLTGGDAGDGRQSNPFDPDTGGTSGTTSGTGGADYNYTYAAKGVLTKLTMSNSNTSAPNIAQNDVLTLTPINGFVTLPDSVSVTMGGVTLTVDEGYSYSQATGKVTILSAVTGNIVVTASGVVPDAVDVDTAQKLKDALAAGVPDITVIDNISINDAITLPDGSILTVAEDKTLSGSGNIDNKGEIYVLGSVTKPISGDGKVYETPNASVGGKTDTLTGLKPGESYVIDDKVYTADASGNIAIQEDWYGKEIDIAQKTKDPTRPAPSQSLDLTGITQADAPPAKDFTVTHPSASTGENSTGKVEGIGSDYEYSTDGGLTWTAGVDDTAVENLTGGTTVLVRVPGTATEPPSKAVEITIRPYRPSGGGSTTAPPATPGTGDSLVIVDGKPIDAGKVTVDKESGETKTVVNQDIITGQIDDAKDNVTVIVPMAEGSTTAAAELVVKNIDDMARDDMTLTVMVGGIAYELPATAVDTAAIMAQLGTDDPAQAPFTVHITPITDTETQALVEQAVEVVGGEIILPAMDFVVTASFGGKTVTVPEFGAYVSRTVEVTAEQAAQITTGLIIYPDGTSRHVPTEVFAYGGKWYARINSLTNSTYVLVYNELTFSDAKDKWFEPYVNEMGSRMVINGVGDGLFAGERSITRAEFASIIVRAMGLPFHGSDAFHDVHSSDWYADAVNTAAHYGIVSGRGNGVFDPKANITREEAMTMIQRAAGIAQYDGTSGNLTQFSDADRVSGWAEEAVRFNVGSGLIVGSDGMLRPKDEISRAETATVVLRLLQQAGLVDKRS